jgi:hypothetical protein
MSELTPEESVCDDTPCEDGIPPVLAKLCAAEEEKGSEASGAAACSEHETEDARAVSDGLSASALAGVVPNAAIGETDADRPPEPALLTAPRSARAVDFSVPADGSGKGPRVSAATQTERRRSKPRGGFTAAERAVEYTEEQLQRMYEQMLKTKKPPGAMALAPMREWVEKQMRTAAIETRYEHARQLEQAEAMLEACLTVDEGGLQARRKAKASEKLLPAKQQADAVAVVWNSARSTLSAFGA